MWYHVADAVTLASFLRLLPRSPRGTRMPLRHVRRPKQGHGDTAHCTLRTHPAIPTGYSPHVRCLSPVRLPMPLTPPLLLE